MTLADSQWSLRSLVQGCGTQYELPEDSIVGLGNPDVNAHDVSFGDRDGQYGGTERYQARQLTFPVLMKASTNGGTPQQVRALEGPLLRAWLRSDADLPLTLRLEDKWPEDEVTFFGRPRPVTIDRLHEAHGFLQATCQFRCLDPLAYGAQVTASSGSSPLSLTNAGDLPTYRFTVTITGNGGTPHLTAPGDGGRALVFNTTLGGGVLAVLDFYTTTLTVGGVLGYPLATDEWFKLVAGATTLTFSGAASISITYRPAYL